MKKINIILLIIITIASQAQEVNNPKDATNFLEAYLSPLGEGLANGLNNGWYNTAKPHKLGGFDITLTINNVIIPNQKQSFNPNKINNFKSNVNSTPTILGKGEGAIIEYEDVEFKMPQQSTAISFVPIPALNIGLGLIKKTEINARYIPKYSMSTNEDSYTWNVVCLWNRPPELYNVEDNFKYDPFKVDAWSVGTLIVQLLGGVPWLNCRNSEEQYETCKNIDTNKIVKYLKKYYRNRWVDFAENLIHSFL